MPTTLTNGIQLPDKGSVDWYSSMQSNYNLIDTHLGDTDVHVTAEDKANWNSKQGSLSQAQLDAIAQVATNTDDIATLQSGKADASHTHSSSDITDIGDYATKQYVDNSISGLVDNAPAALDTLNELSAALNDDSNFASTVTTALAAKADSADLATVATSGSYTDLTDKPTINDSTITIQKNGSTVDTFTTNGSNKTINITVPTKTSDITNNSNFVDTSNSAVASGITSAKVTDYDTHIADTDIHVTTTDKTKWNNGVSQAYVVRYASVAVSDNSTVPYTDLNNTDNVKANDLLLDTNGKLYQISSVDTANETVSVTTPLTQLAVDSGVMHLSGNETASGEKTFNNNIVAKKIVSSVSQLQINAKTDADSLAIIAGPTAADGGGIWIYGKNSSNKSLVGLQVYDTNTSTFHAARLNMDGSFTPTVSNNGLGSQSFKWVGFNGINPGALSMPDLSKGIDISGYINTGDSDNSYTPLADGYISVRVNSTNSCALYASQGDVYISSYGNIVDVDLGGFICSLFIPVVKNVACRIVCRRAQTIVSAKFYPNLGNV